MWKKLFLTFVVLCVGASLLAGGYVWNYRRKVDEYARAVRRVMPFGALDRSYELFVPRNSLGSEPVPLLLVLHGGGGTGKGMQYLTLGAFNDLAEREGFLVVYPDGYKKNWNDGRVVPTSEAHSTKLDDVGFLKAVVTNVKSEFAIDENRIYACGISNGAFMSARLAIEASDVFAAVALVTGSLPTASGARAVPQHPVSVMMINGTEDELVRNAGGAVGFKRSPRGTSVPVAEAVKFWVEANGCASEAAAVEEPDSDPADGTKVWKQVYDRGKNGTAVVYYEIRGGGHTWPGGAQYAPEFLVGKTSKDLNACQVIWQFFKQHPKSPSRWPSEN